MKINHNTKNLWNATNEAKRRKVYLTNVIIYHFSKTEIYWYVKYGLERKAAPELWLQLLLTKFIARLHSAKQKMSNTYIWYGILGILQIDNVKMAV